MVNYQWGIFMVNLNPVIGSEQASYRPVVVISDEEINQKLPIITVLPITSYKKGREIYPVEIFLSTEDSGLIKDSVVMAHQIRAISKGRLQKQCGEIWEEETRMKVCEAIKTLLDLHVW